MILKCPQCNAEFVPLSVTQIYCSSKCGNKYRKKHKVISPSVTFEEQATEEHVFAVPFVKRNIGDTRRLKTRLQGQIFILYRNIRVGRGKQMNKMTTEKAIEQLEDLIKDRESFCHCDDFDEVFLQDIEACKMGIQALEKQMSKKVTKFNEKFYSCPNCMKSFNGAVKFHYCSGCGQALDWSDS